MAIMSVNNSSLSHYAVLRHRLRRSFAPPLPTPYHGVGTEYYTASPGAVRKSRWHMDAKGAGRRQGLNAPLCDQPPAGVQILGVSPSQKRGKLIAPL